MTRLAVLAACLILLTACTQGSAPAAPSASDGPSGSPPPAASLSGTMPPTEAAAAPVTERAGPEPMTAEPSPTPTMVTDLPPSPASGPAPGAEVSAIPSTETPPLATPEPTPEPAILTLSIVGPDGEVLLEDEELDYTEGMTAEDALRAVCDAWGIALDIRAPGTKRAYILSIGDFGEKQQGTGSGWVYQHNGVQVPTGIGALKPEQGDSLRFLYTLDWGASEQ